MTPSLRPNIGVVASLISLSLLTGCGGSDPNAELPDNLKSIVPTESPTPTFTPFTGTYLDSRKVAGEGWTMQVPAKFEEQSVPGAGGTTTYRWIEPTSGAQPPVIAVVTDPKPQADAIEQSKSLEIATEASGTVEVQRSEIAWPGAERAILLQWTQPMQGGVQVTTWQLMVQVNSALILNAVAVAPEDKFTSLKFADVLATFKPAA